VVEDGIWTPPVPLWACGTMRDGAITLGCSRDRGLYGAVVWRSCPVDPLAADGPVGVTL